jgi:hypothetical protein
MDSMLYDLIRRLEEPELSAANVLPWGSPVPSFGDISLSRVATLGLNPSNREFVDSSGRELDGTERRFHTLKSLSLSRWSRADRNHVRLITDSCRHYFKRNPYNGWFRVLDWLIGGTKASFYGNTLKACHLDLIPYATACKWTELTLKQRSGLLNSAGDTLGLLLRDSPVRVLILNGQTVTDNLQKIAGTTFQKEEMPEWLLPRKATSGVKGFAYKGYIQSLGGISLKNEILILGFNHNIQSSFGVTGQVKSAIRSWITRITCKLDL